MSIPAPQVNGKSCISLYARIVEDDLNHVEAILHDELSSAVRTVTAVSRHILQAGGKRLRPALVILSARACQADYDMSRVGKVAAAMELIHMATLLHDDVIDNAGSRRGRATVNSRWGNQISVLSGDYMLSKATSLLAEDGDIRLIQALSKATIAMTEGEIKQIEVWGDLKALREEYISIIRNKTAEFMSSCCVIGGFLGDAAPVQRNALAGYGLNLGMAFQITDDLLDITGDPNVTGKSICGDISEGKVTMPIILAMEKSTPKEYAVMEKIILNKSMTLADIDYVKNFVYEKGAVEDTLSVAKEYLDISVKHLEQLPQSEYRTALDDLAKRLLYRDR